MISQIIGFIIAYGVMGFILIGSIYTTLSAILLFLKDSKNKK